MASGLCHIGELCLKGQEVFYPGSTFFIDPDGMTTLQLLFVFLAYGYVLFISADMIGDGAELLLLVPEYADMVGSMVLPILGAIPDGMMVLFSGIGPLAVAQENVAVGVGALAGSTIMLLTLPWILSVYAAQVDCDDQGVCVGYKKGAAQRKTTNQTACQFQPGVTNNAWLMFLTSLSYFVIQIPAYMVDDQKTKDQYASEKDYLAAVMDESASENKWAFVGMLSALFFFFFYLYLQYLAATTGEPPKCLKFAKCLFPPKQANAIPTSMGALLLIDKYRKNFLATGHMRVTDAEKAVGYGNAQAALVGGVKIPADLQELLMNLFNEHARNSKTSGLHKEDMLNLLRDLGLKYSRETFTKKFVEYDTDKSESLERSEFLALFYGMVTGDDPLPHEVQQAPAADGDDDGDEEENDMPEEFSNLPLDQQRALIIQSSLKQMLIGTILVLIFSDPMVDVLAQIGKVSGVPAFYVSFVLAPLASNASELVASYKLAARKTSTSISQSLQCLEGAACMNNTFCLGIFFFLIYYQGLAWKFTAETLSIFLSQFLVFLMVIKSNTQTVKTGFIIFCAYPVSLVFVAALESMGLD